MGNAIEYTEEMVGAKHPTKADTLNRALLTNHSSIGKHTDIQLASTGRISSSGGTIEMTVGGTTAVTIDSSGGMRLPLQPAFSAVQSSNQIDINVGASTMVAFQSEQFDQNNDFSTNTFTAPVTGKFFLAASIQLQDLDTGATRYQISIITSNYTYRNSFDPSKFSADAAYYDITLSVVADMDASDTAYAAMHQTAGAQQTDLENAFFSGSLLA